MPEILKMDKFTLSQGGGQSKISVNTGYAAQLFQGKVLLKPNVAANEVGCFTLGSIGNNGKVIWSRLKGPQHILKPRQNGCSWDPKGRIIFDSESISTVPVEIQMEQCVDALWTDVWERILGVGVNIRKMMSTPEGRQMVAFIIERVYDSIQNSVNDLTWFGKNAYIDQATASHWYTVDQEVWEDYVEQQDITAGFHTLIATGASTYAHWNLAIAGADVTNGVFDGSSNSIKYYLDLLKDSSTPELQTLADTAPGEVAYYLSPSLWKAYKDYLIATFGNIPEAYYLVVNGVPDRRFLMYDDIAVVAMREWTGFDRITGTYNHIGYLAERGIFGIVSDIQNVSPQGIGLEMVTYDTQPHKGMTYIDSDFKIGYGILDTDMVSRIFITITP